MYPNEPQFMTPSEEQEKFQGKYGSDKPKKETRNEEQHALWKITENDPDQENK